VAADLKPLVPDLEAATLDELAQLPRNRLEAGTVLFRPGDEPSGFVLVLDGEIAVHLTGRSGREISLYEVAPGQTCVQTTLCLLGQVSYSAEAVAKTAVEIAVVPAGRFHRLLAESAGFRTFVFRSLGNRLSDVTGVLEQVAFVRIEARLAQELLRRAGGGEVATATHQELAAAIGSAREVISRRLEVLSRLNLVTLERGSVRILDRRGLVRVAETSDGM
jgi:CRP/FNR family transcriptional regulator, anaerobic regulatory protein